MASKWTPERIADYLNRLPMVEWDRGVVAPIAGTDDSVCVIYGWILREDGHRDYVQLEFASWYTEQPGFTTSSARFSAEMHARIFGPEAAADHTPCVPVKEIPGLAALVTRTVPW